jgi:hypothetical protein
LDILLAAMNSYGKVLGGLNPHNLCMDDLGFAGIVLDEARSSVARTVNVVEKLKSNYLNWDARYDDTQVIRMFPGLDLEEIYKAQWDGSWWTLFPYQELNAGQIDLVRRIWTRVYQEQPWCNSCNAESECRKLFGNFSLT